MDATFEYMKAAVDYAAKHGYKATFKEFPKCKHPSTLERYRKRVLNGTNELTVLEVRCKIKKRILDETKNGTKVDVDMVKEYFKELESNCKMPDRLKGTSGFLIRCLREVKREGGEAMSDEEEDDELLDKLNDFLEEEGFDHDGQAVEPNQQSNNGHEKPQAAGDANSDPGSNCGSSNIDFSSMVDVQIDEQGGTASHVDQAIEITASAVSDMNQSLDQTIEVATTR